MATKKTKAEPATTPVAPEKASKPEQVESKPVYAPDAASGRKE